MQPRKDARPFAQRWTRRSRPARVIRVGIAGLGTVGGEAVRLLAARKNDFIRRLDAEIRVDAVCDRDVSREASRLGLPRRVLRTKKFQDLIQNRDLDLIVETLGGLDDARKLVLGALKSGKHVVTANKRLLAHHWTEIIGASQEAHRRIYFEASVAGGIPILQAISQSLSANRIRRVSGILNGTTNFILTQMENRGFTFDEALREAQRLGLAEKNPKLDLDGTDAAHKASIIASLVTGHWVRPESVDRAGILGIQSEDIRFAVAELGRTVRLLGIVDIDWSAKPARLTTGVAPTLISLNHPLASVQGEYNALLVEASAAGDLMFYGKGAGAGPAGSAVVGDIFMLSQEILQRRHTSVGAALWGETQRAKQVPLADTTCEFYLRLRVSDRPGVLSRITGILARHGVSIAQIYQGRPARQNAPVPVHITTHAILQRRFDRARSEILKLSAVDPSHCSLRTLK